MRYRSRGVAVHTLLQVRNAPGLMCVCYAPQECAPILRHISSHKTFFKVGRRQNFNVSTWHIESPTIAEFMSVCELTLVVLLTIVGL